MTLAAASFLGFVIAQRLFELWLARRNTTRLLAEGAVEHGAAHYPFMVALHASWVLALVWFGHDQELRLGWLALYAVLQVFRVWILATLGRRWTTRVIVSGEPLVARGPFRLISHPNYALVVAEIAVAPMVLGLGGMALVFTLLNAAMLWIRVRSENRALAPYREP